jgi:hypothetical protein
MALIICFVCGFWKKETHSTKIYIFDRLSIILLSLYGMCDPFKSSTFGIINFLFRFSQQLMKEMISSHTFHAFFRDDFYLQESHYLLTW